MYWKIIPVHGKERQYSDVWSLCFNPQLTINPLLMFMMGMSQNPDGSANTIPPMTLQSILPRVWSTSA